MSREKEQLIRKRAIALWDAIKDESDYERTLRQIETFLRMPLATPKGEAPVSEGEAYQKAGEYELEIAKVIGDYEAGKYRIPIVKIIQRAILNAAGEAPEAATLSEAQLRDCMIWRQLPGNDWTKTIVDWPESTKRLNAALAQHIEAVKREVALKEMIALPIHAWPNVGDDPAHPYPQEWVIELLKYRNKRIAELEKQG